MSIDYSWQGNNYIFGYGMSSTTTYYIRGDGTVTSVCILSITHEKVGGNQFGQLGIDATPNVYPDTVNPANMAWIPGKQTKSIHCGITTSYIITMDNFLYSVGQCE
jgi:alpha-tubulin suppressor-like RCC1 family protein